jgi:hypothetical protein
VVQFVEHCYVTDSSTAPAKPDASLSSVRARSSGFRSKIGLMIVGIDDRMLVHSVSTLFPVTSFAKLS